MFISLRHLPEYNVINPVQVNTASTDVTKMSSDYAENELELFRKTVSRLHVGSNQECHKENVSQLTGTVLIQMDLIVASENGKASSTDILNSADMLATKKLKKSATEHLLTRLVHDKWLNEVNHIHKSV